MFDLMRRIRKLQQKRIEELTLETEEQSQSHSKALLSMVTLPRTILLLMLLLFLFFFVILHILNMNFKTVFLKKITLVFFKIP